MKKLIFIFILLCSSVLHAQSPFDSFDTTMKDVPLYKSKKPQVYRLYADNPNSSIKYIQVDADKKTLDYYDKKDSLVASAVLINNKVKFLSVDPLTKKYPELTPYQFGSDRPIDGIDLDGLEYYSVHIIEAPDGTRTKIAVVNYTNIPQQGMNNVKTKSGYGPQGDVGVNYTITKVDKDGKPISSSGFNVKNIYGVYAGPDNPKQYWAKPVDGEYPDDYSLPPIDETDANAKQHDLDYDHKHLKGFAGVMDDKSTPANEAFIKRAEKTYDKYKKGQKDDITGKPVTKKTADVGMDLGERNKLESFKSAEIVKKAEMVPPPIVP